MTSPARAYLDWNASAPLRAEARAALLDALDRFGNPSSVHAEGRAARDLVESAREAVASFMGCRPSEVVFTSGGTEANNLAIRSLGALAEFRRFAASRVEHPSVLRPLEALEAEGWEAVWLPAGEDGVVAVDWGGRRPGFAVLQAANHETGTLQPLEAMAEACARADVPWLCDAVQAWGRVRLRVGELGCAMASLSGHKLGAPKGVGALFIREGFPAAPALLGGPQERGRRAGTENVPGIAALGAACEAAERDLEADARWMAGLRDRIEAGVRRIEPLARINGPEAAGQRLPNTANLVFPGVEAELLVQALDLEGVAVSAGAACASGAARPSEVLRAMGLPEWRIKGAVRVSLGPATRAEDVDRLLQALSRVLPRLKGEHSGP